MAISRNRSSDSDPLYDNINSDLRSMQIAIQEFEEKVKRIFTIDDTSNDTGSPILLLPIALSGLLLVCVILYMYHLYKNRPSVKPAESMKLQHLSLMM